MIGVVTEEIANNAYGFITLYGELGLTAGHGFTAGQVVYLGVDGALTTQPTAAAKIKIGVVAPGDRLLVIPHVHFKLESASNFFINTAIADTDVIVYDGANGRWNNITKAAFLANLQAGVDANTSHISVAQTDITNLQNNKVPKTTNYYRFRLTRRHLNWSLKFRSNTKFG